MASVGFGFQRTDRCHGIFQASLEAALSSSGLNVPPGLQKPMRPVAVPSSIHAPLLPGLDCMLPSIDSYGSGSISWHQLNTSEKELEVHVHVKLCMAFGP